MKRIKTKLKNLVMVIALIIQSSCSFQKEIHLKEKPIRNISEDIVYTDIIGQGYMGGSLIYNDTNKSLGHLDEGVTIAIRLSKAERKIVNDSETVFNEKSNSALYGIIVISTINYDSISFDSLLYNLDGSIYKKGFFTINKNEKIDIDGDGLYDLQYSLPNEKRFGYEKAVYLNFLSSQENLNITMYAVLREQYYGETYPNGIIGVNNDEKFIIQKYVNVETEQRSVITGVYKGDYVVDNSKSKYQKVISNRYERSARSVSDSDLEDLEENLNIDEIFSFIDEDFAFINPEALLEALPSKITARYDSYSSGIDKLNSILCDRELLKIICEEQETIIPEEEKNIILNQFNFLEDDEVIQLNRVFLEENYPISCPQRVTVSDAITQILPLTSIVFTVDSINENEVTESLNDFLSSESDFSRATSNSFSKCKTKDEYEKQFNTIKADYYTYKNLITFDNFQVPVLEKTNESGNTKFTTSLNLKNTGISIGVKGSYSNTWGSIKSSLGAAVFFEASSDIDVVFDCKIKQENSKIAVGTNYTEQKEKTMTIPVIKKKITLYEYEINKSANIARFVIGPVVIAVNFDFSVALPVILDIELDTPVSYSAYLASITKVGIDVGVDYGVKTKKKYFIKYYVPYVDFYGKSNAQTNGVFFFSQNTKDFNVSIPTLTTELSIEPYIKMGLNLSIYEVIHAGVTDKFGLKAYAKCKYENPYLIGTCGLRDTSVLGAKVFIGYDGVKILGINIGHIGKQWEWNLLDNIDHEIIPETELFKYKL